MEKTKSDTDRQRELEEFAKKYYIFMDTNAVIDAEKTEFWNHMEPVLREAGKKVVIPAACAAELEKIAYDEMKEDMFKARAAIRTVNRLLRAGDAVLVGTEDERKNSFADPILLERILKYGRNKKILVVTNDTKLAVDILSLTKLQSTRGYALRVMNVGTDGYLSTNTYLRAKAAIEDGEASNRTSRIHFVRRTNVNNHTDVAHRPFVRVGGPVVTGCKICGSVIDVALGHSFCAECAKKVFEKRTCRTCGESFEITFGELDFMQKNNNFLPTHCKHCRASKREKSAGGDI